MGKKDSIGKIFFADRGRFAELLNIALYQGENIIRPENLRPVHRDYLSPLGKGEKSRDIFMEDVVQKVLYGLELEAESDYGMPERIFSYDACEWEQQIWKINKAHEANQEKWDYKTRKSRMAKEDILYPVITVVLYLGSGHWQGRSSLSEMFRVPKIIQSKLKNKIPDYGFTLIEADFVNADDYRTDLREFFQAMQCRKDKKKLNELCRTEKFLQLSTETAWAIAVHLNRKYLAVKVEKEGMVMCQAFDELMEDKRLEGIREGKREGKKVGKREGKREGKKEERIAIIRHMLHEGMDQAIIRRVTKCSKKELAAAAGR